MTITELRKKFEALEAEGHGSRPALVPGYQTEYQEVTEVVAASVHYADEDNRKVHALAVILD